MQVFIPTEVAKHATNKYLGVLVAAKYARVLNEFPREADVIECVARAEDLGGHRPARDNIKSDRAHELARPASHYYVDLSTRLCKQTRQPH